VSGVLLVCHANTCRSVMAHALLERMLAARGLDDIRVRSAGVARFARDGMLASLDARIVLREVGIHLAENEFTSTDLRRHPELLDEAAVIVTMTADQKDVLADLGAAPRAVLTLRELAGECGDIADPVGQGEDVFRACRDEIARCLDKGLDRLLELRTGA
jgi:protein-tyrosine-phosphatase